MIANIITLARVGLLPFIIILLLYGLPIWAFILFIVAASTDGMDGYFARKFNQVTDFGKFADPLADKILVISILIVLVEMRIASSIPVVIIAARELIVSGFRIIKAKEGEIVAASRLSKIKTVCQIIAVAMLILNMSYAQMVLWLAVIVSIISGIEYGRS